MFQRESAATLRKSCSSSTMPTTGSDNWANNTSLRATCGSSHPKVAITWAAMTKATDKMAAGRSRPKPASARPSWRNCNSVSRNQNQAPYRRPSTHSASGSSKPVPVTRNASIKPPHAVLLTAPSNIVRLAHSPLAFA